MSNNITVQVGYYKLSALETQKVDLINYVKKRSKKLNTNFELYERVQNLLNDENMNK